MMKTQPKFIATVATLASLGALACGAGMAPPELASARDAVSQAEHSQAGQLTPVKVEEARQALAEAENAFRDREDEADVADLSYIAQRKAEIAISAGNQAVAAKELEQASKDREAAQQALYAGAQADLNKAKEELEAERLRRERDQAAADLERKRLEEAASKGQAEVARVQKQLDDERKARDALEKKLASAMASIAEIANVKEESRGVVITLSGAVLFATGEHTLLPIAKEKLTDVAKAIQGQGFKKIIVEGHTDSVGSPANNEALSLRRAQEVRTYLISQGIPADKIEAQGHGQRRPVATNDTPDGRANNRRVELVVTPQ
jgi:outer membrane protein OmpA-like peptidoglycan-associated protein